MCCVRLPCVQKREKIRTKLQNNILLDPRTIIQQFSTSVSGTVLKVHQLACAFSIISALKFLNFRHSVGEIVATQGNQESTDESDADRRPRAKPAPLPLAETRTKILGHMPRLATVSNAARCKVAV